MKDEPPPADVQLASLGFCYLFWVAFGEKGFKWRIIVKKRKQTGSCLTQGGNRQLAASFLDPEAASAGEMMEDWKWVRKEEADLPPLQSPSSVFRNLEELRNSSWWKHWKAENTQRRTFISWSLKCRCGHLPHHFRRSVNSCLMLRLLFLTDSKTRWRPVWGRGRKHLEMCVCVCVCVLGVGGLKKWNNNNSVWVFTWKKHLVCVTAHWTNLGCFRCFWKVTRSGEVQGGWKNEANRKSGTE